MAWMRMMGADSVAYHRETIVNRFDDHPGQALAYYASRGETPLVWGGSGAAALGLEANVTDAQYEAVYGPGGATDPTTGEQLTRTRRPGMELVIAAHKSVAELGVIGYAEDMHRIMDAERDATLAYLDDLVRERGGRRGQASVATPTDGLLYATTRHATSRAGDPAPHDHVLIANAVRMNDEVGGWKAAETTLWREHLHAATMVGRVAAAREAVTLGYGSVADNGPSGRLGHWAIAGVPEAAMEIHSKRAAEITAEAKRRGRDSYQARNVVARDHRAPKRHEPVADLMARWHAELESVGWPVGELQRSVDAARALQHADLLSAEATRRLVDQLLAPEGPLASRKIFSRRDVIVAAAPHVYGLEPAELDRLVGFTLADPEAVALVATPAARERAYATATTIAREQSIAAAVEIEVGRSDAPAVSVVAARRAVLGREDSLGASLTPGQREAVMAVATSGRGVELVVGVAGAGKTTALAAVAEAFEAEGYAVVGTSTSGQAARTLRRQAGIDESRTLASLTWRLAHGRLALTERHVVILDEAAMSDDRMLLGLIGAASAARAKVVMVGDHRQLGAVGPGGGFDSLVARYGAAVHVLGDNVRQHDIGERAALGELRSGDVATAVAWYRDNRCIAVAPDHDAVLRATVEGWAADVADGHQAAMYAWRRADVGELNRMGREAWRSMGRLSDAEVMAPGGTAYAIGDRVVTLAPAVEGRMVTSATATVVALDHRDQGLTLRTDDDGEFHKLAADEIAGDRLAHAYAMTVHRSQGSTVERAHVLEDGGGRELAYVKMSRARVHTTVYAVADSVAQASEDLEREWSHERRPSWVIDSATPETDPVAVESRKGVAKPLRAALRRARLAAERDAIAAVVPPDPSDEIRAVEAERQAIARWREDLRVGGGQYADHPVGEAVRNRQTTRRELQLAENILRAPDRSRSTRRRWRRVAATARQDHSVAAASVEALSAPERRILDEADAKINEHIEGLWDKREERQAWFDEHPEATRRLDRLEIEIASLDTRLDNARGIPDRAIDRPWLRPPPELGLERGIDLGP
jgi:conjugative relaxase-like TrwC/TraI family protein